MIGNDRRCIIHDRVMADMGWDMVGDVICDRKCCVIHDIVMADMMWDMMGDVICEMGWEMLGYTW